MTNFNRVRKALLLLAFFILPLFVNAADIPQAAGWVNDFAGVVSSEYKEKLNSLIEELEKKTTNEIVVVTINSIAPYDEKEYAGLLFDNWKPGKKDKDNGVLILLAIKERRWRIETGYGVEGILPDSLCGEVGRNYMVPYFKEGKYSEGLYRGVVQIAQIIAKDSQVNLGALAELKESLQIKEVSQGNELLWFIIVFFILMFLLLFIESFRDDYYYGGWGYDDSSWRGGGFGGGGWGGFGGGGGGGGGAGGGF